MPVYRDEARISKHRLAGDAAGKNLSEQWLGEMNCWEVLRKTAKHSRYQGDCADGGPERSQAAATAKRWAVYQGIETIEADDSTRPRWVGGGRT